MPGGGIDDEFLPAFGAFQQLNIDVLEDSASIGQELVGLVLAGLEVVQLACQAAELLLV